MGEKKENVLKGIEIAMAELEETEFKRGVKKALDLKISPVDVVDSMGKGLEEVGTRYERKEYFLMELILAGNIANEALETLKPYFPSKGAGSMGKVVIGTVFGDLHTIGKGTVVAMLSSAGLTVIDLGEDVPAERFVNAVREERPDVLALSGLLTIVIEEMKKVIDELRNAGLREKVKVIVGGRPLTRELAEEIGADAYGRDAVDAVRIVKGLLEAKREEDA